MVGARSLVTTLDDLISSYGVPRFIKIDTEGVEDLVLRGLSQPVDQLLFEVHVGAPDVARRAFARLGELADYEFRLMSEETWCFGEPRPAEDILRVLPSFGNVHARSRHPTR